jgi:DNA mismatch repair protein MutS
MVAHYAHLKESLHDCLLLYRVGEFYEILMRDAGQVSEILNLQLTRRKQKDTDGIPMCGIPAASLDASLKRLLRAGRKVAICEQSPEPGGERPLRLVTPGTSVDDDVLTAGRANNLVAIDTDGAMAGLAWVDLSTGESGTTCVPSGAAGAALAKLTPSEILATPRACGDQKVAAAIAECGVLRSDVPQPAPPGEAGERIAAFFGVADHRTLGSYDDTELCACASLLSYVGGVLGVPPASVGFPRRVAPSGTVEIDQATLAGLNVLGSASGRDGSLLSVLDRTVTPAGARLLVRQLTAPLVDHQMIGRRLEMVRALVADSGVRSRCRETLRGLPDLLRATGRLALGKGSPRDLAAVRDGLDVLAGVSDLLSGSGGLPAGLSGIGRQLAAASAGECLSLRGTLRSALAAELPAAAIDGGFVADGYDGRLDGLRARVAGSRDEIAQIQSRYIAETGVKGLRVRTNSVIGYHIEVPNASARVLGPPEFTHRQGLASSSRFTTADLDRLASDLDRAGTAASIKEQEIFAELTALAVSSREPIRRMAHAAAALDLVAGLAQAAAEGMWSEPEVTDGAGIEIAGGRHPVAEALLQADGRDFIPNGCSMPDDARTWVVTGPNMSGKSTFLKQVATIVLMAQIGSFVPADLCRIGAVDKLFSRVGASDDLFRGRSTFMVEMMETARIMNQATARSLVILDEVGRGTSTHDGLSIAQACMEQLTFETRCRTLFATHYHELADAADSMPNTVCMAMEAEPDGKDAGFGYRIVPGKAGKSFGITVARMAGMPSAVIRRAEELLACHTGGQPEADPAPFPALARR